MSYLIDSHTHLHDREFFTEEQSVEMLKNSKDLNVLQMICIGTSHDDSLVAKAFAENHKDVFWTYGTHPEGAENYKVDCPDDDKLVAIGEVGLDYHYPDFDREKQIALLEEMIDLAVSLNLPVSFHVRDALDDFFPIVENFPKLKPSVLHSFSDSKANLKKALDRGFYIGMNGLATFANLDCYKDFSPEILDRLVLETDAPFLTPVPKRGKINEPGNVRYVAEWLSKKLGVSLDEVSEKTTQNVQQVFHLPNPRLSREL